jgi:hypothetical protein
MAEKRLLQLLPFKNGTTIRRFAEKILSLKDKLPELAKSQIRVGRKAIR